MAFSDLQSAQYINLETFKRNGNGVKTPVWQVYHEGKAYVWTGANSWKVKRIRNNSTVNIVPSDARGNPEGDWFAGRARVLPGDAELAEVERLMARKYGLFFHMFRIVGRLRRSSYIPIELSPA